MTPYNPKFLEITNIFSQNELEILDSLQKDMKLAYFMESRSLCEKFGFDFIYSSAQIEGNTYTKAETLTLLEMGITAGGKKHTDAIMVLNLRNAFDMIMRGFATINKETSHTIHATIVKDLVQDKNLGTMRQSNIDGISGCNYVPLPYGERLYAEMEHLLKVSQSIENPFNKALYLHNNIAYLQYFEDCNKRTTRSIEFLSLKNDNIMPLVITKDNKEVYTQYRASLIEYYESGKYDLSKEFFIQNYQLMKGYFEYSKNKQEELNQSIRKSAKARKIR